MMFVINVDLTFQIKTIYIDWLLDRLNEKTMHIMHYVRRCKEDNKVSSWISYSFNHSMNQVKLNLLFNHNVIANPLRKYLPPSKR
jgi:hypothetical protein